jgi:hypothetical protein
MPYATATLRLPNYASAPSSPSIGHLYYDTTTNATYYWNGTAWINTGPEVFTGTSAPAPRGDNVIWIDTTP